MKYGAGLNLTIMLITALSMANAVFNNTIPITPRIILTLINAVLFFINASSFLGEIKK